MRPEAQMTFPKGADRRLLERFARKSLAEREKRFNRCQKDLLLPETSLEQRVDLDEKAQKAFADLQRRLKREFSSRPKPPKFVPLKGHNPARYAPFEYQTSFIDCGGEGPFDSCVLRGPNKITGQIGANLQNFAAAADPTDLLTAMCTVGFWFFAPESGTLRVTAQVFLNGRAKTTTFLSAVLNPPTGVAYAGVEVCVEEFNPVHSLSQSVTDIFRSRLSGLTLTDSPFILVNRAEFPCWEARTVSVFKPVRQFEWYLVTVSALQHVIRNGVSDFDMFVGPVHHELV
jgi:hypothetical protein